MIVKNPTEVTASVQVEGRVYEVQPHSQISGVPVADATHWQGRIHQFLEVLPEEESTKTIQETKPAKVETKEAGVSTQK